MAGKRVRLGHKRRRKMKRPKHSKIAAAGPAVPEVSDMGEGLMAEVPFEETEEEPLEMESSEESDEE